MVYLYLDRLQNWLNGERVRKHPRVAAASRDEEPLSLFQICPKDRHLKHVAAVIVLVVDEHNAENSSRYRLRQTVFFWTRHDGAVWYFSRTNVSYSFQLADFLDVH